VVSYLHFPLQNPAYSSLHHIRFTCPAHLVPLYLIIRINRGE
jgi:hypothetical protein